ncbi:hypothetical protein LGZ99_08755 [Photorhabdus temperata]|uniref:Thymidylate kinase n=1 Tax=Photorhabdus temperata subsp. temperata Meg1 TaxID=1393735 RepID=A0A081RZJ6_PHOTE|nr:hypothetical protein [Photorhabdus temperata]KER04099.1 hypothetical protein MEG1DRAFT_01213 [Photorhabdus temperata subsp. temperata Meg1]MCT8347294.1 hypothetical protein [Photorhabdus temperata]
MFVSIEGVDGSGKSTLFNRLKSHCLEYQYDKVIFIDKKNPEFKHKYIASHMANIGDVLWRYDANSPMWLLGDEHWFSLLSSWFSVIDHCIVKPNLAKGNTIVVNNWITKYIARFNLKPNFDIGAFNKSIQHLSRPDKIIFLDIDITNAALRKGKFESSESGLMDGRSSITMDGFIQYQNLVSNSYINEVKKLNTYKINVDEKSPTEIFDIVKSQIF